MIKLLLILWGKNAPQNQPYSGFENFLYTFGKFEVSTCLRLSRQQFLFIFVGKVGHYLQKCKKIKLVLVLWGKNIRVILPQNSPYSGFESFLYTFGEFEMSTCL
jgi:hypothetical protein